MLYMSQLFQIPKKITKEYGMDTRGEISNNVYRKTFPIIGSVLKAIQTSSH